MTTQNKIDLLEKAMTQSKREDGIEYFHFTDEAPQELKDLYLNHFEVRDLDYEIFSTAIDTLLEAWNNNEDSPTLLSEYIEENYYEHARVSGLVQL